MLKQGAVTVLFFIGFSSAHLLGHCQQTALSRTLIRENLINVVYTMDSSSRTSLGQALRLPKLKRYFERKGVRAHFVVGVNNKTDAISGLAPVIHVDDRDAWQALGMRDDRFYIIDRCGRLVFEIVKPWSNLDHPFVRASILTAQQIHRCGLCPNDYRPVEEDDKIAEYPALNDGNKFVQNDPSTHVVVKLRHSHKGDSKIYNYIVRMQGNSEYHGHHPSDRGLQRRFLSSTMALPMDGKNGDETSTNSQDILSMTSTAERLSETSQTSGPMYGKNGKETTTNSQDSLSMTSTAERLSETSQTSITNKLSMGGSQEVIRDKESIKTLDTSELRLGIEKTTPLPQREENGHKSRQKLTEKERNEERMLVEHLLPILERIKNTEDYLDYS